MQYDILLIGGNGFVGRVLAAQLQTAGYSVLIPTSHPAAGRELRMLPKIHLEDADIHEFDELQSLCARVKSNGAVINLVGVLHDKPAQPYGKVFQAAHVDLPKNIITAMQLHGLKRYLHMSALGADSNGPSMYQRSKGDGEAAVKASNLDWTIFRPSVIFGAQDQFINLFARLTKLFPAMPLANHQAQFQPVSVDDVASAFVKSLTMPQTIHHSYDLVGPKVYTMKEIVEFAARKSKTSCAIIPVPAFVGYLQALAFEFLPGPTLMSRDNIASMSLPNTLPLNGKDALTEVFQLSRRSLEGYAVMKIYAVGGAIRDALMGLPVHDIDYVVVGSSVEEMLAKGFRPVGKDFPVFLHPETQAEYALARTERKTGKGYKGFHFYADPSVTLEQDLQRRDLTINAMAQEVGADGKLVGPILDPYNGQQDLAAKVFRHVSDAFAEDPLRLLRIARFAARFPEFTVADETMIALKAIVQAEELSALSAERIWQELARGLMASKPMHMFQVLLDTGAAKAVLFPTLTNQLAQEHFREDLIAHFDSSPNRLDERCAILMMKTPAQEIRSWAECVRMPIEIRDFSEIFSELVSFINKSHGSFQAADVLTWFNRADVWRKPDRGQALLNLAEKIGLGVGALIKAMRDAQALNAAEIIASVAAQDRSNGERIGSAFEAARLAAITVALGP